MSDHVDLDQKLNVFVNEFPAIGRLVFAKIWGSYSHNTNVEGSDIDYLLVYAAPTEEIISMEAPPLGLDQNSIYKYTRQSYEGPDFQAHELVKFCRLLQKGNPGILEMLFTDRHCHSTPWWGMLSVHRRKFLTHVAVRQYLGYATDQLRKLEAGQSLRTTSGKYNTKWAYHLMRIAQDAHRICQGEVPAVWRVDAERDYLLDIRKGEYSQEEVMKHAKEILLKVEALAPWDIPEEMPKDILNEWLLDVRMPARLDNILVKKRENY